MKRRDFSLSLAAACLSPILPAPVLAKAASASADTVALSGYGLNFVEAFARYHVTRSGHSSPELLSVCQAQARTF